MGLCQQDELHAWEPAGCWGTQVGRGRKGLAAEEGMGTRGPQQSCLDHHHTISCRAGLGKGLPDICLEESKAFFSLWTWVVAWGFLSYRYADTYLWGIWRFSLLGDFALSVLRVLGHQQSGWAASLQEVLFWFGAPHFETALDTAPQWLKMDLWQFSLRKKRPGKMVLWRFEGFRCLIGFIWRKDCTFLGPSDDVGMQIAQH